jgi:membrane glycosyltransferase
MNEKLSIEGQVEPEIVGPDAGGGIMPPERPLPRRIQNLAAPYRDETAPGVRADPRTRLWRVATFVPAFLSTALLIAAFADWFGPHGIGGVEFFLLGLVATTFFWIALCMSTVTVGIVNRLFGPGAPDDQGPPAPLRVALLVPIYNEVPWDVFGNAAAMLEDLQSRDSGHEFSLFILSDTRDPAIAAMEEQAMDELRATLAEGSRIFYRRRVINTDRKVGNLADWVERWGGAYEAMLVLDADSLMAGPAIVSLADELSRDPSAGLIQSFPQLFGAQSLFGRVQQFSSAIYGSLLSEGLATWTDREGNYWGHNAIIRTAAFASCAGLPKLRSRKKKDVLILSHDFVEAGLLRRAGWSVRFLPRIKGSYEESPATLVDYVIRDRRWCQGNLQHLNILNSRGFHAVSRFHLFSGAMSYLLSPCWFVLLVFWALLGKDAENNVVSYFNPSNPMVVDWPEVPSVSNVLILFFMYGMLLAPKVLGVSSIWMTGVTARKLGGWPRFLLSFMIEIVVSVLFAPVLMVQQTLAVLRTLVGIKETWKPQQRSGGRYGLRTLAKFHWLETVVGALLLTGMGLGVVSLWLLPIAFSLAAAIPLSALSGVNLRSREWSRWHLGTPEEFDEPDIIRSARLNRLRLRAVLDRPQPVPVAAE